MNKIFLGILILLFMAGIGYIQQSQYAAGDKISFLYFLGLVQFPLAFILFRVIKAEQKKHFHFKYSCFNRQNTK